MAEVERVSPEAPIPVLSIESELKTLGGAGNVLRNLTALGATASFISVVGNDEAGREIRRLLEAQDGAEVHVLVPAGRGQRRSRPVTSPPTSSCCGPIAKPRPRSTHIFGRICCGWRASW